MTSPKSDPDERFSIGGDPEDALRHLLGADLSSEPPPGLAQWQAWWEATGRDALNGLLHGKWDPIETGVPLDEYSSYVPIVGRLLREGQGADEIAAYLATIRTTWIGLPAEPDEDARAAALIVAWYAESGPQGT